MHLAKYSNKIVSLYVLKKRIKKEYSQGRIMVNILDFLEKKYHS